MPEVGEALSENKSTFMAKEIASSQDNLRQELYS